MRKSIVIVITVALLGFLGTVVNGHSSKSQASSNGQTNQASSSVSGSKSYKDGTYKGDMAETPYGTVQIAVVVANAKITDINFLKMPNGESRSQEITSYSEPALKQNTLQAQSANIDFVSGATSTSYGYQQSLQAALDKAAGSSYNQSTNKA